MVCVSCNAEKKAEEFNKRKDTGKGYRRECRDCQKERSKKYYSANSERLKEKQRNWNAENKEKKKEDGREWYLKNQDKVKASRKKWEDANPEKVKERIKRWAKNNPERARERSRRWRENNPDMAKEVARNGSLKIWNSPTGRINGTMSSAIRRTLRGAKSKRHWEDIVGYSVGQLRHHIERQFTPDMNWGNYGKHWEIDHIIPIKVFNFNSPDHVEFKKAWSLSNLRPLEKSVNRRKSAKIGIL